MDSAFFSELSAFHGLFKAVEYVTIIIFCIEYVLRIWTADLLYPRKSRKKSVLKFLISFDGIIDLLTILPFFFLDGMVIFRMLRVVRIFHLFRINSQYDSFNLIKDVLIEKRKQLFSSLFLIVILVLASSLAMYGAEHDAQPEAFENAFSGIWWSVSTLLTVGYGDIYPVTVVGRIIAIFIAFLGVCPVAVPTGIISAGFVEEYQRAKRLSDVQREEAIHFIEVDIRHNDKWNGRFINDLGMPKASVIAAIVRKNRTIIPRGNVQVLEGDKLIICAEAVKGDYLTNLREVELKRSHSWNGKMIREIDMSRQSFIILVDRGGNMLIPDGDLVLRAGDKILLYTKESKEKYIEEPSF